MSGYFTDDEVRAWLVASCESQGVPVLVTDTGTLARVAVLLGVADGRGDPAALAAGPRRRHPRAANGPRSGTVRAGGNRVA